MKNWLDGNIEMSYRELFQMLIEHGNMLMESDIDVETLSFDNLITLYQDKNDGNLPYNFAENC